MLKKILYSAISGACLMGMVATANADVYNVNIYGASAQYKFWTSAAPDFLLSRGCAEADIRAAKGEVDDKDHGIAWCAGTVGVGGVTGAGMDVDGDGTAGDDVFIRYSANASYDGVNSVQNIGDTMPGPDQAAGCGNGERLMADETAPTWVLYNAAGDYDSSAINATACKDVNVGASDVAAETFNQESHGYTYGHIDYALATDSDPSNDPTYEDRYINGYTIDASAFRNYRPLVVPFAFFANESVPFDCVTRLMVTAIYSGQITNWGQFDPTGTIDQEIVVCLRHAGSGTHATLDAAIMRGDATLLKTQVDPSNINYSIFHTTPLVWFNAGSSDIMTCVDQNDGAIGYADADKNASDKFTNVKRMAYGYCCGDITAPAIYKDVYTNGKNEFWSNQWLYVSEAESTELLDLIDLLDAFAADPANLPSSRADYWAAENEMDVIKTTDFAWPSFK